MSRVTIPVQPDSKLDAPRFLPRGLASALGGTWGLGCLRGQGEFGNRSLGVQGFRMLVAFDWELR